jgi:urease accessory protein
MGYCGDEADMKRACIVKRDGEWTAGNAIDHVVLDADDRHRRRVVLTGECGTTFLVDLPRPTMLQDGDAFELEDGSVVQIVSRPELLLELRAAPLQFVRLAWHLGNRHADLQIAGDRLRIRRDHVLRDMAVGLGASVRPVEAPFDPEGGSAHGPGHDHDR